MKWIETKVIFLSWLWVMLGITSNTYAQLPISDFTISASACSSERLSITNNSQNANFYEWDFCEGDLFQIPPAANIASLTGAFNPKDMDVVKDGNSWYGFATSRSTNSIYRINYGSSPGNASPFVTNLGNIGSAFSGPEQIKLINENGNWFGLVVNGSTATLVRLSFGTSLSATPTTSIVFSNISAANSGMDIGIADNKIVAAITNASTQVVSMLNFGNSITNNPTISDVLTVSAPAGAAALDDITLIRTDGIWYGFMVAFNSRSVYRLTYGSSLFSIPTIVQITGPAFATEERPSGIVVKQDRGKFIGFVQTFNGVLYSLDFGTVPTTNNPAITKIGNLGVLANSVNLELVKHNSSWYGFVINQTSLSLSRITFPDNCLANQEISIETSPYGIKYSASGTYYISLVATDQNKNTDYASASIVISNSQAPDISISSENVCANHDVNFISQNTSANIVSYDWDFGDSNSSTQANPTHQYLSPGQFNVHLKVTADNGCENLSLLPVTMFSEPVADFLLPSNNPVCTNQLYHFQNTSSFDATLAPQWEWRVNGLMVSSVDDLDYAFNNPVSQEIRLKALIPGCENEQVKLIGSVTQGPSVDFIFSGQCEDDPVQFTNTTTGDVMNYSWDFDDGQNSPDIHALHEYADPGQYSVLLTAINSSGCVNSKSKSVVIYSKPQTNFSIPLPPFSCSGSATQFTDLTPSPFDSNLSFWSWDFDDGGSTSSQRNPQHLYTAAGDYQVSLTATTNFGCSTSFQKTITIASTPQANFSNSSSCPGVPVNFTDTSVGTIQSRQWQIENASFTTQNPVYTFNSAGNKNASLSVTATNGCVGSLLKTIVVPVVLSPDFSFSKNCINQETEFSDITNSNADPITNRLWSITGIGTGSSNPQVFNFSAPGNYNVKLSVTTQTGCSYVVQKNVSVTTTPQAAFTMAPAFGEPPLQVQFTNTSSNASSYLWQFNDAANSTSVLASPAFTFTEFGNYSVNLTAYNAQGCLTTFSKTVKAVVPLYDIALTNLELIQLTDNLLKPAVTIHNKGNVPVTSLPIRFDFSGGSVIRDYVKTEILPDENFRYVTSFDVPVTSQLNFICAEAEIADSSPKDNKLCQPINKPVVTIALHPNPVSGNSELTVEWISDEPRNMNFILSNTLGQIILRKETESIAGLNTIYLRLESLRAGLYFLQIDHEYSPSTFRVMVY